MLVLIVESVADSKKVSDIEQHIKVIPLRGMMGLDNVLVCFAMSESMQIMSEETGKKLFLT